MAYRRVRYGGWWNRPECYFTTGTWMLGTVDLMNEYTVRVDQDCKNCKCSYRAAVWVHWYIREDLDLEPGPRHGLLYNAAASCFAAPLWHDMLGGRRYAPLHADWYDFFYWSGKCTDYEEPTPTAPEDIIDPPEITGGPGGRYG